LKTSRPEKGGRSFICIHGHFYQPPRENPWLEEIEVQDSASPYHDWNDRIAAECYAPNLDSRILGPDNRIAAIINNFSKISHDIGPTLMSWLEHRRPDIYSRLIQTDRDSRPLFSGHGPAIAQAYNHTILPLARSRDKRLQIIWGIYDFLHRYGREPEGLWLPETAVDTESLDILAEQGIKFTILAPRQASRIRPLEGGEWMDVRDEQIDSRRPYLCRLPSGRTIAVFFYDGPASRDIAFGQLLKSGDSLASRMLMLFSGRQGQPELVHVATDGETFGHHHKFTEMALSFALRTVESRPDVRITVYAEYLEKHPPDREVEIIQNSSWSCIHGVERWRSACGCSTGGQPDWDQDWRAPLRRAVDWLNEHLSKFYEKSVMRFPVDPWALREDYIRVILDRSTSNVEAFFHRHDLDSLDKDHKSSLLQLLEMQRACQLMFTSCGWFFDEISGIEPVQILKYAARAMQLGTGLGAKDPEPGFVRILEKAPSNLPKFKNGADVYHRRVKPEVRELVQAGAHFAVSTAYEENKVRNSIRAFEAADTPCLRRRDKGKVLSAGTLHIRSILTWEEKRLDYAVYSAGGHHLFAGLAETLPAVRRKTFTGKLEVAFALDRTGPIRELMDRFLGGHSYSLQNLFKDQRRVVMAGIMAHVHREFKESYLKLFHRNYPLLLEGERMGIPLPEGARSLIAEILSARLLDSLKTLPPDRARLEALKTEMAGWDLTPDKEKLAFTAVETVDELFSRMDGDRKNTELLRQAALYLSTIEDLNLTFQFRKAQTIFFHLSEAVGPDMKHRAEEGDDKARDWLEAHRTIARILRISDV
jgi:alpha-amylase/alpha-mannosidase (GH57 family)